MGKRPHESDSDDTTISMAEHSTVFVDSNLDTHLAMLVSSSDTVSDFKEKMVSEHMKCFPTFGRIQIQSMKVKRRSKFYHLPDIMLVWSAFKGVKGNWFLFIDASCTPACGFNQNSSRLGISDGVKMKDSDDCRGASSDANRTKALPMTLADVREKDGASEMTAGVNSEKSLEKTTGFLRDACSAENCKKSHAKKNCKKRHVNEVCHNPSLRDSCNLVHVPSDARNDQSINEATAKNNNIDSDKRKDDVMLERTATENVTTCKEVDKLAQNVPTESLAIISDALPDYSTRLMDPSGTMEDVNSDSSMRKKKKSGKMVVEIHDKTHVEQAAKGDSTKLYTETHKPEEKEEERSISLKHDHEVTISSDKKTLGHAVPDSMQKESVDARAVMESEITSGGKTKKKKKKRKKGKESANADPESSGIEQTNNGISGSLGVVCLPTDLLPEANDNEDGTSDHPVQDVQMKVLDSSTKDASEEVQGASRNDADFVACTQSSQTDVTNAENIFEKSPRSLARKCHVDFPPIGKDQGLNQVDKNNENTEKKDKKIKRKRKKVHHSASNVQESLPVKVQKVGTEVLMAEESLVNLVRSKEEAGHVTPSSTPSNKSEEKVEEMNRTAVETGELAKISENEAQGIDFKQYFLSGQYQGEIGFGNEEKKATKSEVKKTKKEVKENEVPSVSISTKLQNPLKSYGNYLMASEHKSHLKEISRTAGDLTDNSDPNEVIPKSSKTTLSLSGVDVKGSSPSEEWEMKIAKKTDGSHAALSCPKKKKMTLNKSSSERSETFSENRSSEKLQSDLNANKMVMNTKQKKSLLTKSGTIFQDNSGGSSGDELETVHSNSSTCSSDSLSLSSSSESEGESDLSQGSPRNASNDVEDRSTGRKTPAKLDLSATKDMSMEMILRSSKRFKKAKRLASQNALEENESQAPEFVPDSQPI